MYPARRKAVFLDRDGVLNRPLIREGKPYPAETLEQFEIYPEVPDACRQLKEAGFLLVVVTNQPDVARGAQTRATVDAMHRKMLDVLPQIARVEVCWHAGIEWADPCDCRKPQPGMVLRAAKALKIDLSQSFLIGDRWQDIDCGHGAGCRTVFIDRHYSEELKRPPNWSVQSFGQAVEVILGTADLPAVKSGLRSANPAS